MLIQTTKIYERIQNAVDDGYTLISEQGSSRSSKTYNTLIWLIVYCLQHSGITLSIVRKTLPAIRGSVFRDFKEIVTNMGLWTDRSLNKTEMIYNFANGSMVEFFSTDNEQKLRGRKRHVLYVNEANEISELEWQQLKMRTTQLTIIDYNPSFTDEHWICRLNEDPRTFHFISTYKDNPFLEQTIIDEIESLQHKNQSLWQVYGLGQMAIIEGLIFPKVEVVDEIPSHVKSRWFGVDYGYSCFDGETSITTSEGLVKIKNVQPGMMVLTRQGWRPVVKVHRNGVKEVVKKQITMENGNVVTIAATNNHNFNVNGKWKKYGQLTKKDTLCLQSNTEAGCSSDTRMVSTQTTTTINGRKTESITARCCIMQYTETMSEIFQTAIRYITSTRIRSITRRLTSCLSLHRNMRNYTETSSKGIADLRTQKETGACEGQWQWKDCKQNPKHANGAEKNTLQQTCISDTAAGNATENGNTRQTKTWSNVYAKIAAAHSEETSTTSQQHAAPHVHISYLDIKDIEVKGAYKTEVYDLTIDGVHEYFANGVLVHNCDPTAIVEVARAGDTLYVDEIAYATEMLTSDIIRVMKAEIPEGAKIWSESADPRLVAEIHRAGLNIYPVRKYKGSIEAGINKMLEFKICITARSLNVKKEFKNYTYAQDRDGKWLNTPIDCYNHAIDAVRYVVLSEILAKDERRKSVTNYF